MITISEAFTWTSCEEKCPDSHGYYFSAYFNKEVNETYYKAIWWNGEHWVHWRPGEKFVLVYACVEDSRNDYYCPCMDYADKILKDKRNEQ